MFLVLLKKIFSMKKLLLIFLFSPMILFGQDKSFELGLLFGGSLNSLNGDSEFTKKTMQPVGGILMQYNFNDRFSINSKSLYHIKGGKKSSLLGTEEEYDHRLDFHYVTLPLLAQWNFGKNKWRFFCNTGPYLGYLTRAENVFEGENIENHIVPRSGYSKKIGFGLILGSGVSFQMSEKIKIFLELSFDHALTNISARASDDVVLTQAMTGAVGLTYNFPIKKKTFNGTSTLKCADYDESLELDEKKKSKWRLVLYKDGKKVGKKSKRGKSRLFKKKD